MLVLLSVLIIIQLINFCAIVRILAVGAHFVLKFIVGALVLGGEASLVRLQGRRVVLLLVLLIHLFMDHENASRVQRTTKHLVPCIERCRERRVLTLIILILFSNLPWLLFLVFPFFQWLVKILLLVGEQFVDVDGLVELHQVALFDLDLVKEGALMLLLLAESEAAVHGEIVHPLNISLPVI